MSARRSRRWTRAAAACATVGMVGVLARADAPPDQYQPFDQSDVTITDKFTGLQWQRTATWQPTLTAAVAACASLRLQGATGWRLPSYKELLTLVDESPHTEYPTGAPQSIAIDGNAFPFTSVFPPGSTTPPTAPYWTSSPCPAENCAGFYLAVDFSTGAGEPWLPTAGGYARCVVP